MGLLTAVVLAVWLGHGLLLRGMAAPLVSEQTADGAAVMVLRGDERGVTGFRGFDAAEAFYHQAPGRRVLLIGRCPGRLVELGILSSFATLGRRELSLRGVPDAAIETIPAPAADPWEEAELLAAWLRAHPGVTAAVYCNALSSRHVRYILDRVASPAEAAAARIVVPHDSCHDATNWWKTRSGVKEFMLSWLEMAYTWRQGRRRLVPQQQSVQAYRKTLGETFEPRAR
jgi:hypothetical protein